MHYHDISDKSLKEFKELCEKEGIKYETEAEYKSTAQKLVGFGGRPVLPLPLEINGIPPPVCLLMLNPGVGSLIAFQIPDGSRLGIKFIFIKKLSLS